MMKSYCLQVFLVSALLVGLAGTASAKSSVSTVTKASAKHTHAPLGHGSHVDQVDKSSSRELVRMPHALPNGWRRPGEEVSGGTGF